MNKWKIVLSISSLLLLLITGYSIQGYFYSENYAQELAFKKVKEFCARNEVDEEKLFGPVTESGSLKYPHHYSWNYDSDKKKHLIGTWIAYNGHVELYSGPLE